MFARFLTVIFLALPACTQTRPLTVIDSGHTLTAPGAISCTHRNEVDYNDDLVAGIARELTRNNRNFILTRTADKAVPPADDLRYHLMDQLDDEKWRNNKELYGRIALANEKQAGLYISIHHDSVQERHLLRAEDGKIVDVRDDHKQRFDPGYLIFIASDPRYPNTEQHYPDALKFAKIIAEKMQAMDRKPSTYVEENLGDENYQPIDLSLGIYNSKGMLAVLRNAKMPAVLIEAGVIVDVEDEKIVSSQAVKDQLAVLIAEGINAFLGR